MAAMLVAALLCPVYNWLFVSHLGWGLTGAALANDAVQVVCPLCCAGWQSSLSIPYVSAVQHPESHDSCCPSCGTAFLCQSSLCHSHACCCSTCLL